MSYKQILHWQVSSSAAFLTNAATNHVYIDTLPFDGVILQFADTQNLTGLSYTAVYNTLLGQLSPLTGVLKNVTHNWLHLLSGNVRMQDPFDSWTQTITNWVTLFQAARDAGFEGVMYDPEEYNIHQWQYNDSTAANLPKYAPGSALGGTPTQTLSAYELQYHLVGKQLTQAILAAWPQFKLTVAIGPNRSSAQSPYSGAFAGDPNHLAGYFFSGLFEGAPNNVIDGGEHYYDRTLAHYQAWQTFERNTINAPPLVPASLASTWSSQLQLTFGLYDQDPGSPIPPAMSPSVLQSTMGFALQIADHFIWNYSETLDWLTSGAGAATGWIPAVLASRTAFGLPAPGTPEIPTGFSATSVDSTHITINWSLSTGSGNPIIYVVQRKTGAGSFATVFTSGTGITTFADSGLTASTTYSYQIQAKTVETTPKSSAFTTTFSATTQASGGLTIIPSMTQAQIQSLISGAASGSTITWSAGNYSFTGASQTSCINFTQPMTIVGAGQGLVNIHNTSSFGSGLECSTFGISLSVNARFEISGMTLTADVGGTGNPPSSSGINITCGSVMAKLFAIHDITFYNQDFAIVNGGNGNAVIGGCGWNLTFNNVRVPLRNSGFINAAALHGFSVPSPAWGTDNYFVFEDSVFNLGPNWSPSGTSSYLGDTEYPMNYNVRKCVANINRGTGQSVDQFDMHGSGGSPTPNATQVNNYGFIIHDNTINFNDGHSVGAKLADIRGGIGCLVYNNSYTGQNGNYTQSGPNPGGSVAPSNHWVWNNKNSDGTAVANNLNPLTGTGPLPSIGPPPGFTSVGFGESFGGNTLVYPHPLRVVSVNPTVPTGFSAMPLSSTSISVIWTASGGGNGNIHYVIQRSPTGTAGTFVTVNTTAVGVTSYTDTGRSQGTPYWYQIQAVDSVPNSSAFTATFSATTLPGHTAATASRADVLAAYNLCVAGDTLLIPATVASGINWTQCIDINKSLIIQGNGGDDSVQSKTPNATVTRINNTITFVDPGQTDIEPCTANDTMIFRISPPTGIIPLASTTSSGPLASDVKVRITGIYFDQVTIPQYAHAGGYYGPDKSAIHVFGFAQNDYNDFLINNPALTQIRVDNCFFNSGKMQIHTFGKVFGVIDHNTFLNGDVGVGLWGYDSDAWTNPPNAPGTINAMFIEDNKFYVDNNVTTYAQPWAIDHQIYHQEGARSVIRNNVMDLTAFTSQGGNSFFIDVHGNQGYYNPGHFNFRGNPLVEIYNNTLKANSTFQFMELRGGSILCYNNTCSCVDGSVGTINLWEEECWQTSMYGTLRAGSNWPAEDMINASFFYGNHFSNSGQSNTLMTVANGMIKVGDPGEPGGGAQERIMIQENRDFWQKPPDSTTHFTYPTPASPSSGYPNVYSPITSYVPFTYPHPLVTPTIAPDTNPPTVPTGLIATSVTATTITVSWTASTDDITPQNQLTYSIFQGAAGLFIFQTAQGVTTYTQTGLTPSTTYHLNVHANDSAGNHSAFVATDVIQTTTGTSGQPLFVQGNQQDNGTGVSLSTTAVSFNFAQSAGNLNVVVIGWHNDSGATGVGSVIDTVGNIYLPAIPITSTGVRSQQIWYSQNSAASGAGNLVTVTLKGAGSVTWDDPTVTWDSSTADWDGGSVPASATGFVVSIASYASVDTVNALETSASSVGTSSLTAAVSLTTLHNVDLIFYGLYAPTAVTAPSTGFTERIGPSEEVADQTVLSAGTQNISVPLSTLSPWIIQAIAFRALSTDLIVPSVPQGVSIVGPTNSSLTCQWTTSTDNVDANINLRYPIEHMAPNAIPPISFFTQFGVALGVSAGQQTFVDNGLTSGVLYSYRMRAMDTSGNLSAYSATFTGTTSASAGAPKPLVGTCTGQAKCSGTLTSASALGAPIQHAAALNAAGTTMSLAFAFAQQVGDCNIVSIAYPSTVTATLSDSVNGPYALAKTLTDVTTSYVISIYYRVNILAAIAGANTVTTTFSASVANNAATIHISEWKSIASYHPVDDVSGASGTGTAATSGNTTTTHAADLLYIAGLPANNFTAPGAGYTLLDIDTNGVMSEYQIVTTTSTYVGTGTIASGGAWSMIMAAFKSASGVSPSFSYPVKVSANNRYLVDQNNTPFLLFGETVWPLVTNLTLSDADIYFQDRAKKGFNAIFFALFAGIETGGPGNMVTVEGYAPFNSGTTTFSGTSPFNGHTITNTYNLTATTGGTSANYFNKVKTLISMAAAYGFTVMLDPIEDYGWANPDGSGNYPYVTSTAATCTTFGQFLGTTFAGFKNLIWSHGDDYQNQPAYDTNFLAIVNGIKSNDTVTPHIHTLELKYTTSLSTDDANWISAINLNQVYTYYPAYAESNLAYQFSPTKPAFLGETIYEGTTSQSVDDGTVANYRRQSYWALTSGALTGYNTGTLLWDLTSSPSWKTLIDSPGIVQVRYLWNVLAQNQWWNLVPDLTNALVVSGGGTRFPSASLIPSNNTRGLIGIDTFTTASITTDGLFAICYTPIATTLTLNMALFSGPVNASWMDPSTGVQTFYGNFVNSSTRTFTTPGVTSDGLHDFVLILNATVSNTRLLAGTCICRAQNTGLLRSTRLIKGTCTAKAQITIALIVSNISGTCTAKALNSGSLRVTRFLAGTCTGRALNTGLFGSARPMVGTCTARALNTGLLRATKLILGTSTCSALNTGQIVVSARIAGVATGRSINTGILRASKLIAGTSTGRALNTGTLINARLISGTSTGRAQNTGLLRATKLIAGTSTGIASNTGLLRATKLISGTATGKSSNTGVVFVPLSFAGISTMKAANSGSLTVFRFLVGTCTGRSLNTGILRSTKLIIGTCTTRAINTGTLNSGRLLAGTCTARALNTGILGSGAVLAGTCTSRALNTGKLGSGRLMAGTCTAHAINTGLFSSVRPMAGQCTARAQNTGVLRSIKPISGTCTAQATHTGMLRATKLIQGTCTGSAINSVKLASGRLIVGTCTARANGSGLLHVSTGVMAGICTCRANITANLRSPRFMAGTCTGRSTTTVTFASARLIRGTCTTRAVNSAVLTVQPTSLTGTCTARSQNTGVLRATKPIAGQCTGRSLNTGSLFSPFALSGVCTGRAQNSGVLASFKLFSGTCTGRAVSTGLLRSTRLIAGTCTWRAINSGKVTETNRVVGTCTLKSVNTGFLNSRRRLTGACMMRSKILIDLQVTQPTGPQPGMTAVYTHDHQRETVIVVF